MRLLEAMATYFQGEKIEALVFILPVGLLCLVFGGWLLSENVPGYTRGIAIPFVVMGLVMAAVGGGVGFRTPNQVATLQAELTTAPTESLAREQARMGKVNGAWATYLAVWVAFGVVGFALRFGSRADFAQGLGTALVFFCGVGMMIDGFAERRARPYTQALHEAAGPASGSSASGSSASGTSAAPGS